MTHSFDTHYPSIDDLREKARRRIPRFAFEYLDGGCNEDVNLARNTSDIREIELVPEYLAEHGGSVTKAELFGHVYDSPFGIAPVGLQGLMWPRAPEILARAAFESNIPFILSTVTTSSIERIAEITEGAFWFQLYHPAEKTIRDDIINRVKDAGCPVLVILCDVPTFGYRPRDIRNGLAMPPKMTLANILQILGSPSWALNTLIAGWPNFETLRPYMPKNLDMKQLGAFMDRAFSGRLNAERIKPIRDMWPGKLVLKGVASVSDAQLACDLGIDGIIVSNHGGRQLDAGQSAIRALATIVSEVRDQITVMMDSGLRSGSDVARVLASGAEFTFLGRAFMYGVAALGARGGHQAIAILQRQLQQNLEQLCCENVRELPQRLPCRS